MERLIMREEPAQCLFTAEKVALVVLRAFGQASVLKFGKIDDDAV